MNTTLGDLLAASAQQRPDSLAVIDRGRALTYGELDERANRVAHAMSEGGLARGARVAVQMDNRVEAVEIFAACAKAGFTYVPLDSRMDPLTVGTLLVDCGAELLITDEAHRPSPEDLLADLWTLVVGEEISGDSSLAERERAASPDPPAVTAGPDDIACLLYTSGTTGRPKGVCTTHRQLVSYVSIPVDEYDLDPDSRYLVLYPHSSAAVTNSIIAPAWETGCALVLVDVTGITPAQILDTVSRERVTHFGAVPTMLVRLLGELGPGRPSYDLGSLTTVWYGSTPMAPAVVERLLAALGPVLVHVYGMTEFTGTATTLGKEEHQRIAGGDRRRLASCGCAVAGVDLEVVGDAGTPVATGEVGEIRLRSDFVMDGYWKDPERTGHALRDGWLRTGDLAYLDDDDFVYIVDRKADLIVRNGTRVASKEVEDALHHHEAVLEVAVVGAPYESADEQIYAYVALAPDRTVAIEELFETAAGVLDEDKRPSKIRVLDSLPKNAVGKIQKGELRQRARAEQQLTDGGASR